MLFIPLKSGFIIIHLFKKKVYICVINDLVSDARIQRQASCFTECGWDVLLLGRIKKNSLPVPEDFFPSIRFKVFPEKGVLFYFFFQIQLFFKLLFLPRPSLIISNDTDTLLPVWLISVLKNVPFFYDSHELFWEVPELENAPIKRLIWKGIERSCIPKARACFTVNASIARILEKRYQKTFHVVRNIPSREFLKEITPETEALRNKLKKWSEDRKILLYQGSGINIRRGLEEMLDVMTLLPDNYLLVLIGGGDVWDKLKKLTKEKKLDKKVLFIEKIPRPQLEYLTPLAHAGLSLDKPDNPNYLNSLPNKIFDYIHAGIPVISSAIPEIIKIVQEYKIGLILTSFKPEEMAKEILQFMESEAYKECRQNIILAQKEITWEKEKQIWLQEIQKIK
jgi:glycosyltransferase involved in cell wall biosynthesis